MSKFKKQLTPMDIWSLALGAIIGWGCFVLPGTSFLPLAGPLGTAIGLIIGGFLVSLIGINYSYLVERYPQAGGGFIFTYKNFGKVASFICGWFLILGYISIIPLNATAIGVVARYIFPGVFEVGYLYTIAGWDVYIGEILLSTIFLIMFAYFNIRGIRVAGIVQKYLAFFLTIIIMGLTLIIISKEPNFWINLSPGFSEENDMISGIVSIVAMAPWAYAGFDCVTQVVEEFKFETSKIKGLIILSITVAAVMYICVNTITAGVLNWQEFAQTNPTWATGDAIEKSMGIWGVYILGSAMLCAVISGINGFYVATSRLVHSLAKKKILPQGLGEVDKKYGTPKKAIIIIAIICLIAPWFGRSVLDWIVNISSVSGAIGYLLSSMVLIKLGKRERTKKLFVMGILGTIIATGFLIILLVPGMPGYLPLPSRIILVLWIVIGAIVYYGVNKIEKSYKVALNRNEVIE